MKLAAKVLLAWLITALVYLPVAQAETPIADSEQSARLTDYLHAHRLPLVGAQVLNSQSGPSVMLYGYTATDFGKRDAETKTRRFLKDSDIAISNHIRVRPELLSMKAPSRSSAAAGIEAPPPDVSAYENQQQEAQQQYLNQQAQAYMNQGNSAAGLAGALIPLLGLGLAIGLGGSGSGFGMGVSPGFGYGGSYGSPYGINPYGNPYGPNPYGSPYSPYP